MPDEQNLCSVEGYFILLKKKQWQVSCNNKNNKELNYIHQKRQQAQFAGLFY